MAEVAVPDFVNGSSEELGSCLFGSFVGGKVLDENDVLSFAAGVDDSGGIVGHDWIRWWAWQYRKQVSPRCCVGHGGLDQSNEIVRSYLIVGDVKEERVQDFPDGS
jgi:hypothetical protein